MSRPDTEPYHNIRNNERNYYDVPDLTRRLPIHEYLQNREQLIHYTNVYHSHEGITYYFNFDTMLINYL